MQITFTMFLFAPAHRKSSNHGVVLRHANWTTLCELHFKPYARVWGVHTNRFARVHLCIGKWTSSPFSDKYGSLVPRAQGRTPHVVQYRNRTWPRKVDQLLSSFGSTTRGYARKSYEVKICENIFWKVFSTDFHFFITTCVSGIVLNKCQLCITRCWHRLNVIKFAQIYVTSSHV
jgi:hypothetical protein